MSAIFFKSSKIYYLYSLKIFSKSRFGFTFTLHVASQRKKVNVVKLEDIIFF